MVCQVNGVLKDMDAYMRLSDMTAANELKAELSVVTSFPSQAIIMIGVNGILMFPSTQKPS